MRTLSFGGRRWRHRQVQRRRVPGAGPSPISDRTNRSSLAGRPAIHRISDRSGMAGSHFTTNRPAMADPVAGRLTIPRPAR
jgi:hypothetical protein